MALFNSMMRSLPSPANRRPLPARPRVVATIANSLESSAENPSLECLVSTLVPRGVRACFRLVTTLSQYGILRARAGRSLGAALASSAVAICRLGRPEFVPPDRRDCRSRRDRSRPPAYDRQRQIVDSGVCDRVKHKPRRRVRTPAPGLPPAVLALTTSRTPTTTRPMRGVPRSRRVSLSRSSARFSAYLFSTTEEAGNNLTMTGRRWIRQHFR